MTTVFRELFRRKKDCDGLLATPRILQEIPNPSGLCVAPNLRSPEAVVTPAVYTLWTAAPTQRTVGEFRGRRVGNKQANCLTFSGNFSGQGRIVMPVR